jgi:RNA polymerase sigma factor (sigma-70 family)
MSTAKLSGLMGRFGHGDTTGLRSAADGELLTLFVASRDEEAFAELVHRHGGLVFGVCRRVTSNHHLAEDAFQAVFVVLATKAAAVRPPASVAAWLHGVAWRTATRARTMADRRRRREARVAARTELISSSQDEASDAVAILDEEIARLPEHYRLPLVLCELEGQSRKEVAERLGIPEGTLSSRLGTARKRLAERLRQRGIALSTAALTAALAQAASAMPPVALVAKATIAATRNTIPAHVASLSYGVLRIMFLDKLKITIPLALLAAGLIACVTLAAVPAKAPPIPLRSFATTPLVFARHADPLPAKVEPKPLPKGPNKLLFYKSGHLAMIDPDGTNEKTVCEGQGKFHPDPSARLSPDGKKLAVLFHETSSPENRAPQRKLYVRELAEKELGTDLEVSCQLFAWSPDGTKIVTTDFVDGPQDKKPVTVHYLVDVKTKEKKTLMLSNNHVITDWTPDGKYFLTSSITLKDDMPITRLHLMNMDGTEHKALTDEQESARFGRISPDGTKILYLYHASKPTKEAPRPGQLEIHVLDIVTGKKFAVSDLPLNGGIEGFCWSPDGKRIAYTWREMHEGKPEDLTQKETESHIVVCDPDGKNQKTIASEKGQGQWVVTIGQVDWR